MIKIGAIDMHASSNNNIFSNLSALAEREDLYTGDDFYFGFSSSNQSFLDILRSHHFLAIKYGSFLSLYRQDTTGSLCTIYYIDAHVKTLLPVINIAASPSGKATFQQLLPFSFVDYYLQINEVELFESENVTQANVEGVIQSSIEKLMTEGFSTERTLHELSEAVSRISTHPQLTITLADLFELQAQVMVKPQPIGVDDFIAPYNPFYNNERITLNRMLTLEPTRVTVRQIEGHYPRIEIIAPGASDEAKYNAVYKSTDKDLYITLQTAIKDPGRLTELLKEHYAGVINEYLRSHSLGALTESSKGASSLGK